MAWLDKLGLLQLFAQFHICVAATITEAVGLKELHTKKQNITASTRQYFILFLKRGN